jgi:hypothetical protein
MIDKANAIAVIMTRAKKLAIGRGFDLRTFKRDRSIIVRRVSNDVFHVLEDGFQTHQYETDFIGLKKLLKALLKREFPRSNKIRVYNLEEIDAG